MKLFSQVKKIFTENISVGLGGSETVKQIGLLQWLRERKNITLFDQYEAGITMEENVARRRNGLLADIFVSSSNAITQSGYLVNVDGAGNRVAAHAFGPKKVVLIVGKNKIMKFTISESEAKITIMFLRAKQKNIRYSPRQYTYSKRIRRKEY